MSITREEANRSLIIVERVTNKEVRGKISNEEHNKRVLALQVIRTFINQQTTPTDIEEVRCSKCNFSGSHLIKLSHQKIKDRIRYECLNCGNIEVVLTSTPIKDTVVKEKGIKFTSIEKVIEEFEELDTEYEQTDLDNIQMFISKIQQIIKEGKQ